MSDLKQKRNTQLLEIGFKELKGQVRIVKSFQKGIPITSISVDLRNVFLEDVDFIVSELIKHKEFLGSEMTKTFDYLKS